MWNKILCITCDVCHCIGEHPLNLSLSRFHSLTLTVIVLTSPGDGRGDKSGQSVTWLEVHLQVYFSLLSFPQHSSHLTWVHLLYAAAWMNKQDHLQGEEREKKRKTNTDESTLNTIFHKCSMCTSGFFYFLPFFLRPFTVNYSLEHFLWHLLSSFLLARSLSLTHSLTHSSKVISFFIAMRVRKIQREGRKKETC